MLDKQPEIMESMHLPENRELHDQINKLTILELSPVLTKAVEQGINEGLFQAENPLSLVQYILAGSQVLFDSTTFNWTDQEVMIHRKTMQLLIERALNAEIGSFNFLTQGSYEQ